MERLIAGLAKIPAIKIYGITDPARFAERCPTLALRVINQTAEQTPLALASKLGIRILHLGWNYYALNLTERLDVEKSGGSCASAWCITTPWGKWTGCWLR